MRCTGIISIASLVQHRESMRFQRFVVFKAWLKDMSLDKYYREVSRLDDASGYYLMRLYRPHIKF